MIKMETQQEKSERFDNGLISEDEDLKTLQGQEIEIHNELLKHIKNEGNKRFFELLKQYVDVNIELEKFCNQ